MNVPWKSFWETYRYDGHTSEDTLLVQVGRTVGGKPVSQVEFDLSVQFAADALELDPGDTLFEYCCGNGLVTYELAAKVARVLAIDFTEHLIDAARRFRNRANIQYFLGDATDPLPPSVASDPPTKVLMSFALSHFDPGDLARILENLKAVVPLKRIQFLLTGIPDAAKQWDFYNTPERKARFLELQASHDAYLDGIGRWWKLSELEEVAGRYGLEAVKLEEPGATNHFRLAVLMRPQQT